MYISTLSKTPLLGIYSKIQGGNLKETTRMGFPETAPPPNFQRLFSSSQDADGPRFQFPLSVYLPYQEIQEVGLPTEKGGGYHRC